MTENGDFLGVEDAEVPGFDARPLVQSASELTNHVTLRKSSTVEAGDPVDVGSAEGSAAFPPFFIKHHKRHIAALIHASVSDLSLSSR